MSDSAIVDAPTPEALNGESQNKGPDRWEFLKKANDPVEKLHPVEFTDADGAKREVFTFKNHLGKEVKVVFYTREELPFSADVVKGNFPIILGEAPKHRDKADWDGFINDVKTTSGNPKPLDQDSFQVRQARETDQTLLFVENTPVHLLDLAFHLGLEGKEWRDARQKAAQQRIYTPAVLSLIDDAIAGTVVKEDGGLAQREDQRGEALAIMALMGDPQARQILDQKKLVLEKLDMEKTLKAREFHRKKYESLIQEGVKLPERDIHVSHITKYKPEITDQGIIIRSSFDGSEGYMTRNTVHFSLGGPITSAFGGGGWENMPYLIEGNLTKIKDANEKLAMICPVDTYFITNPGQPLRIPDGHITMPGKLPEGTIRETKGNVTLYKDKGFTPFDINKLFEESYDRWAHNPREVEEIQGHLKSWLKIWLNKRSSDSSRVSQDQAQEANIAIQQYIETADISKVFEELRTVGIEGATNNLLGNNLFDSNDRERVKQNLEQWIATKVKNKSFFESVGGYYGKEIELLAASWDTKGTTNHQAHFNDADGGFGLEFTVGSLFYKVKEARADLTKWDKEEAVTPHKLSMRPNRVTLNSFDHDSLVDIHDRKAIMSYFRNKIRFNFKGSNEDMMLPQNRRMFYVAGAI